MITFIPVVPLNGDEANIGNPPAGYFILYVDGTGTLKIRDSQGNVAGVGGGGGGSLSAPNGTINGTLVYAAGSGPVSFLAPGALGQYLRIGPGNVLQWQTVQPGGGSATLSGLSDVNALQPEDGRVLAYNGQAGKWQAYTFAGLVEAAGARLVPAGGTAGQMLTVAGDGVTLAWVDVPVSTGGGGGGGGGGGSSAIVQLAGPITNQNGNVSVWFDGDPSTYLDADVGETAGYMDVGAAGRVLDHVLVTGRPGLDWRMPGTEISGGNDPAGPWVHLAVVPQNNADHVCTLQSLDKSNKYRYFRVTNPSGSYGNIAEVALWGSEVAAD